MGDRARAAILVVATAVTLGCDPWPFAAGLSRECQYGGTVVTDFIPACLQVQGAISPEDRAAAEALLGKAAQLRDSLSALGMMGFDRAAYITWALTHLGEYYSRQLLQDSARFHRMLDQVTVTLEFVRSQFDSLALHGGAIRPKATPFLVWSVYPGIGVYFQPVTTIEAVVPLMPRPDAPLDSVKGVAEALYRYALWKTYRHSRFPAWEYFQTWASGGVTNFGPWTSGLAQGEAVMLFAETYRRTDDLVWLQRAHQARASLRVLWDDGGVLLPDTSHGFWWEEFHPVVRIWNGAAEAVIGMGYTWSVTRDSTDRYLFDRGLAAMKYYTHEYDTGSWTLYSRTQGLNSIGYHLLHIQLMDALYALSGDPWFQEAADRWRSYKAPWLGPAPSPSASR